MIPLTATEPATLHPYRATGKDSHGNEKRGWGPDVQIRVGFEPKMSTEAAWSGNARVASTATLYLDRNAADVQDRDEITVRGKRYRVDGDPLDWRSPTSGWDPGLLLVNVRRDVG